MTKKTILITGATDGIGKRTAVRLAALGHCIVVHGRNPDKVSQVVTEINNVSFSSGSSGSGKAIQAVCDFSRLDAVRNFAKQLPEDLAKEHMQPQIDVLINNAGVYCNTYALSDDGFEMTIAVNHLAPFLLSHLLLPVLSSSARNVFVSSIAHERGQLKKDLWVDPGANNFNAYQAYADSKLANTLTAIEMARRYSNRNILFVSLHPGVVGTKLLKQGFGMDGRDSLEAGSDTSVYLATTNEELPAGGYFVRSALTQPAPVCLDATFPQRIYEKSAQLVDL